jgi:hypothetical protein
MSVPFTTPDIRLTRALTSQPGQHAALDEYARHTGIDVADVIDLLGPALDSGLLGLETVNGQIFILTGACGRPAPDGLPSLPPNLWEVLRTRADLHTAWKRWRLMRTMQRAGWAVEAAGHRIMEGLAPVGVVADLGVSMGGHIVPVLDEPDLTVLGADTGPLSEYERAGCRAVAVTCHAGGLDAAVTGARRWISAWQGTATRRTMQVAVLEAPGYEAVIVDPADTSIAPRTAGQIHRGLL